MNTTKLRVPVSIGIFIATFIISFLAWPSTIPQSNATISMQLCQGVYLGEGQSDCGPTELQTVEKKYFAGYRYMSEVYGITENSQIDQSKFSAIEAVRGSLILAIVVTGISYTVLYLTFRLKDVRKHQ